MKINLFVNYYQDKSSERQKEIDHCFIQNYKNKLIDVVIIEGQDRILFSHFFRMANKMTGSNDINIIANSDIFFDESIQLTKHLESNEAWCLTRWDLQSNLQTSSAVFMGRADSQDSFIWRGRVSDEVIKDSEFVLGFRGSDNRICRIFHDHGYKVSNPSKTIKSYHNHITGLRNYDQSSKFLFPGPYLPVHPTDLDHR